MQVLIHLGLNKCASTFVQNALDTGRRELRSAGTWYPVQDGPPCQYGLSRHYGFGPDDPAIKPQTFAELLDQAATQDCDRLILSSEYLSLARPKATEALLSDIAKTNAKCRFVIFSRDVFAWIRSLFNQYVKTVEGPGQLDDIDAFVDQTLRNRAIDLGARIRMWRDVLPSGTLDHFVLDRDADDGAVLTIFEQFAGLQVELETPRPTNRSIEPPELHRIGQLRRKLPTPDRDAEIQRLMTGGRSPYPAPEGFLDISPDRRARIIREIVSPYAALPARRVSDLIHPPASVTAPAEASPA